MTFSPKGIPDCLIQEGDLGASLSVFLTHCILNILSITHHSHPPNCWMATKGKEHNEVRNIRPFSTHPTPPSKLCWSLQALSVMTASVNPQYLFSFTPVLEHFLHCVYDLHRCLLHFLGGFKGQSWFSVIFVHVRVLGILRHISGKRMNDTEVGGGTTFISLHIIKFRKSAPWC